MSLQSLLVVVSTRVVISLLHFCSLITSTTFWNLGSLVTSSLTGLGTAWHSPTGGLLHKILEGDYFWRWDKSIILFCLPTIPCIIPKHHPTLKTSGCHINFSFSSSMVSQSNKLKISCVRDMSGLNVIRISILRGFSRESSWLRWSEWQGWHFDTDIIQNFKYLVTFENGLYQKFVLCEIKTYIPDLISRNPRRVSWQTSCESQWWSSPLSTQPW